MYFLSFEKIFLPLFVQISNYLFFLLPAVFLSLSAQADPQQYNDEVIFPDKVRINVDDIRNYRFSTDLRYLYETLFGER